MSRVPSKSRRALPAGDSAPVAAARAPDSAAESGPAVIRVVCVDDHALLVEGLKAQFAIDGALQIVGQLDSAERLDREVARLKPDIVLLDIEMPGPDVFEIADRLHHVHPEQRFVFLSAHVRDGYLAAAYKCGACGYFAKGDDLDEIVSGIKDLARSRSGTFVMSRKVREHCGRNIAASAVHVSGAPAPAATPRPATPLESLTPRELEVLRLIGKGLSRVEIAAELSRSAKTVDGHQDRMLRKLGLSSRAELMRFAIREGLAEA